ncbi:hypothetical protein ACT8ZV_23055 [Nocardioides sp. MAHUQ-72]|uniref:hypothetical protein n=1 Tax=unclassified Nocardioides TaxID=2615069 RepID=UPI0036161F7D
MSWVGNTFDWMDTHNGFLLLLATAAYVVITWRMARQGKDAAEASADATESARASALSAEATATAMQAAAEASREGAAAAVATAKALASAADVLRAMIPVQFQVRMVPVLTRALTLEIECPVATVHIHAVRLTRVAYPTPLHGLPTRRPLAQPLTLQPTNREHELPRSLHPGEKLLASTGKVQAGYVEFVSVEIDYTLGTSEESPRTYRVPVEGFASGA